MKDRSLYRAEIPKIVFSPKMGAFGTMNLAFCPVNWYFVPKCELWEGLPGVSQQCGALRRA
jgi:hypothetical protein